MKIFGKILGWFAFALTLALLAGVILAYTGVLADRVGIDLSATFSWLWIAYVGFVLVVWAVACLCSEGVWEVTRLCVGIPVACVIGLVYRIVELAFGIALFIPYLIIYLLVSFFKAIFCRKTA